MVLSAISQYPVKAYAGLLEGDDYDVESYINNAGTAAGVYDLVFTAVNSNLYTATIYGIAVSYQADGSATLAEIKAGILAAIAAQPALVLKVTSAASGNNVRVTELDPAGNGPASITGLDSDTALTVVTAHSEPEPMPAGILIVRGSGYQDGRLMRASGDVLVGAVLHQHAPLAPPSTSNVRVYSPNSMISAVKRGKIWMPVEQSIALTDTPFVRFAVGAGGSQLGAIRKDTDSGTAVSLSGKASFKQLNISGAGSVALLQINLVP